MIIHHESLTEPKEVEQYYEQKGDSVRYCCTSELDEPDVPVDIFYRNKSFGDNTSRYFGLYWDKNNKQLAMMNADMVEGMTFAMIENDNNWYYSSTLSDEKAVGDKIIGGGRQQITGWGFEIYRLEEGQFVISDK
tara:strand:+ start:2735 stop:3139 length:405 start_codon:yes stop_codon:yes gene_type:complete